MTRYSIKANVEGSGLIHHLLKAKSEESALQRIKAAYPGREISNVRTNRRLIECDKVRANA